MKHPAEWQGGIPNQRSAPWRETFDGCDLSAVCRRKTSPLQPRHGKLW
jgi:hypothetical protein